MAADEVIAAPLPHDQLETLFVTHQENLVRAAQIVLGNRHLAEDVVSEVFAALWQDRQRLAHIELLLPYVRRSVINRARSAGQRSRKHDMLDDHLPQDGAGTADQVVTMFEYRAVLAAVRRLPRRQMTVVILRYWHGMTIAEVAAAMNISEGAVKAHGFKATTAMKRTLERDGHGPID